MLVLSRRQRSHPRGKEEEGGIRIVEISVPFQNSCLSSRNDCRAGGGCFFGCHNGLDMHDDGGLVGARR